MKEAGIFTRALGFLCDVLFQLMLIIALALCIYFFFHFETVTERLIYIIGTLAVFYLLHKVSTVIVRKLKG